MSIKMSDNIFVNYISSNRNKVKDLTVRFLNRALGNQLLGSYVWYLMIGVVLFVLPLVIGMPLETKINFLITLLYLMGPVSTLIGEMEHTLSKDQQKREALIYSMFGNKDIFIFDEWAAEQDPVFRKYFHEFIIPELKEMGKTVIAVTHDDTYFNCAERIIKFDYGRIIEDQRMNQSKHAA